VYTPYKAQDPVLLNVAYRYLTTCPHPQAGTVQQLVNSGSRAVIHLLYAMVAILNDNIRGETEETAEQIAISLTTNLPHYILEIAMTIDKPLARTTSPSETVQLLRSGKVGAIDALFEGLAHEDFEIRFVAGLVLLQGESLPPFMTGKARIEIEAENLIQRMQQYPSDERILYYNMIISVYAAVLYRMGDSQGPLLLQSAKELILDEREMNISSSDFINRYVIDMAGYGLFKLCRENSA
jgi:hypothetical protein